MASSTMSRADSQDTTSAAADAALLDGVRGGDHAVEHAEAGVREVEDLGAPADAEPLGHGASRGGLEVLAADAGVDEQADVRGAD
jgi:hypothetical protein